jgi:hypothetical protein
MNKESFIIILVFLSFLFIIYRINEYEYEALREYYPGLTRWEKFTIGRHLMIQPKKAEK